MEENVDGMERESALIYTNVEGRNVFRYTDGEGRKGTQEKVPSHHEYIALQRDQFKDLGWGEEMEPNHLDSWD